MDKKVFVLDTNVILHDSRAIYSFKEHDVCIPLEVIEEIDHFKKGLEVINFNAREFAKIIDSFSSELLFDGGASLGKGLGKIRIKITFTLGRFRPKILSPLQLLHLLRPGRVPRRQNPR